MMKPKFMDELLDGIDVEWKPLGEVGQLVRGNGLSKNDFTESGIPAIHYGQIYTYYGTFTTETKSFVSPETAKKLKKVEPGDVVITNTSENLKDVGKAVVYLGKTQAVTGGHATIFKPSNQIIGKYFAYFTQTEMFAREKRRYAKGTKVIDVSATDMSKIIIPIPSLIVQEKIVYMLDTFSKLTAELTAELTARKKQYAYYHNKFLRYDETKIKRKKMEEIGEFVRGTGLQKRDFTEHGIGCIHYGQIYTYYGNFAYETKSFVSPSLANKLRKAQKGDLIIATTSENIEDVCKPLVWLGEDEVCVSGETYIFKHNQNPKYIAYYLQTPMFFDYKKKNRTGTKVVRVHGDKLGKFEIPIPSIAEQNRIVSILDKFDTLTTSITEGLPREIQLRQKQYEYYRELLLSFSKSEVEA